MKRTPLERKTPLRAKTPLRNKKPIQRNRATRRAKPPKSGVDFPPHVREQALKRAGFGCEAKTGRSCTGKADHFHHILMRSQGGKGTIDNCLCVCLYCHDYIHAHPMVSYMAGWLKRGGAVPQAG